MRSLTPQEDVQEEEVWAPTTLDGLPEDDAPLTGSVNQSKTSMVRSPVPLAKKTWVSRKKAFSSADAEALLIENHVYQHVTESEVRLLYLYPGRFEETLIASLVTINEAQLGSEEFPYSAISYAWGTGVESEIVMIQDDPTLPKPDLYNETTDGYLTTKALQYIKAFKIRPNLYEALRHMRDERETITVWADAICIDQSNTKERSSQVSKMGSIYRNAYNVSIWLGSDDEDNYEHENSMAFIQDIIDPRNYQELLQNRVHVAKWANLYNLLKLSW